MPVHQDSYQREPVLHYIRHFVILLEKYPSLIAALSRLEAFTLDVTTRCALQWFILK